MIARIFQTACVLAAASLASVPAHSFDGKLFESSPEDILEAAAAIEAEEEDPVAILLMEFVHRHEADGSGVIEPGYRHIFPHVPIMCPMRLRWTTSIILMPTSSDCPRKRPRSWTPSIASSWN